MASHEVVPDAIDKVSVLPFFRTPFNPRVGKREENRLQLLGRYRLLNPDQSSQIGAMPTYGVPSDHYPLMAKFLLHLKPTEDRQRRAR
jgi:hypothetical protein